MFFNRSVGDLLVTAPDIRLPIDFPAFEAALPAALPAVPAALPTLPATLPAALPAVPAALPTLPATLPTPLPTPLAARTVPLPNAFAPDVILDLTVGFAGFIALRETPARLIPLGITTYYNDFLFVGYY